MKKRPGWFKKARQKWVWKNVRSFIASAGSYGAHLEWSADGNRCFESGYGGEALKAIWDSLTFPDAFWALRRWEVEKKDDRYLIVKTFVDEQREIKKYLPVSSHPALDNVGKERE